MQNSFFRILLIVIICFVGCKEPENPITEPNPPDPPKETEPEVIIPTGDENYLTKDSDYLFDQEKLPTFELNLPVSALARLDANPTAEIYEEGSLTFEGETISKVGIRYKGSVGAFVNCVSGTDWANPSGRKTCTKLSMKIKINWNGSDQKFYGLKKLQFHSMNLDPSQMRDRLGYWLFREMGVPAPRAIHAKLMVNGVYVGLFAFIEQIDGRFTRYNFENGKGNLYKEVWPLKANGVPNSAQAFLNNLKTNEDENPSVDLMRSFASDIATADPTSLQSEIEKWMDIGEIISYAVVDRAIRVDDGPFHWYCGTSVSSCSNHNFYWYEDPVEEEMHLIPWDLDNAFENIISNVNPVTPVADDWGETQGNCQPFSYGSFFLRQRSAACDKLIGGWATYTIEYEQTLQAFKDGPFSQARVDEVLYAWRSQIRAATIEAEAAHGDALRTAQWENALNTLENQIDFARKK